MDANKRDQLQNSGAICPFSRLISFSFESRANLGRPPCSEIVGLDAGALFPILDAAAANGSIRAKHDT
jgi:hypothetical protein